MTTPPFPETPADHCRNEILETIVLGGGCFWCVEAVFRQLEGVVDVASGYAGGTADTANYRSVCSGNTDHAEVVRISFDPERISRERVLEVFFLVAHDPTQQDRQGADIGRQYRSIVFCHDAAQQEAVERFIEELNDRGIYSRPIVTQVELLEVFYPAEEYHQDYAAANPDQPYIACNVPPKLEKLRTKYGELARPVSS